MSDAKSHAYVVEIACAHIAAEVTLNGWHAYRATDAEPRTAQTKLNPWLLEGANPFEIAIGPLGDDPLPPEARFHARVYKTKHGQLTKFDDMLLFYKWLPTVSPVEPPGLTPVFRHTFQVRQAYGAFAWQSARVFDNRDRDDIEALVQRFHDAVATKDEATILDMLKLKHEEMGRALDIPGDEMIQDQRNFLQLYFPESPVQMKPLARGRMRLQSTAGGRLVDVWAEDGSAPVEGSFGDMPFEFELSVANLGGQWTIVR
ncbi:MAG: hypothetical protein JRI23_16545 [Deltaproteobacteria bacterium]|jgi:hypothetical protein|nr:hypothetical protein [Deltaproteobacteria bacterium]MBW2533386.1 hypothetical protein [Deltaproteobacteria bacterium]